MYLGRLAETGPTAELFSTPAHPNTQALLSASPTVSRDRVERGPARIMVLGDPPSPTDPPSGCRFRTRCRFATAECSDVEPPLEGIGTSGPDHRAACIHLDQPLAESDLVAEHAR